MSVALVLLALGLVCSFIAARAVASADADQSRRAFGLASAEVASKLQLAILRELDLVVSAGAFVESNPDASNADLLQWVATVRATERYPELQGIAIVVEVQAEDLAAFAARAEADPAGALDENGGFTVLPPGERASYCFTQALGTPAPGDLPAGYDYCAGELGPVFRAARDTGRGSYLAIGEIAGETRLVVQTPVYEGASVPETVEERRARFIAAVATSIDPHVFLNEARRGHPQIALDLRYRDASSDVLLRSGEVPDDAQSISKAFGDGWTINTYGAAPAPGILANATASLVLIAGVVAATMLALLVYVLGTGRRRALRLVDQRTDELRHQALHDSLTGLPNRAMIVDRIEEVLLRNRRNGTKGAALYFDLDAFKNINDTLGHEIGDRLLQAVAARLRNNLRGIDTIGRMGGDEFVILIDGTTHAGAAQLIAERVLDLMREPFALDPDMMPLHITASIGVAVGDRASGGELLRDADVALYQAKAHGKNRYAIFHSEMQEAIRQRVELEFDLRSAVENRELRLAYQPIYRLDDLSVVGVEALLRWEHPVQGQILPDDFIPILEETGRIVEVGRWVLHEACRQMAEWHTPENELTVSVNVSGRQLDNDSIVDDVRSALTTSGLDAGALTIEMTETSLMRNPSDTARRLLEIKDLGVRIAVDDFGTGYSSLAYLQQFPVDSLKIDRRFTNVIDRSPESEALVRTLVQLGRDLKLTVLAEGVETVEQIDALRNEHVHEAQGFLFARPLAPETFEATILHPASDEADAPNRS